MKKTRAKGLTIFTLAMLISGSIDSIRNLPPTALFGSSMIFFFVLASVLFLIPVSLMSADLGSNFTERGGIYQWVTMAFGEKVGFFAIWLQWINTMVWYPTILSFIAATAAFLIDPNLSQHRWYLVTVILVVFWLLTLLNLRGIRTSARFATVCAVIGMIIPMLFIIVLAAVWVFSGRPLEVHLSMHTIVPSLGHFDSWISLTAILTAFLGLELATVHIKDISNPQKRFPKAMLIAAIIILSTMIFGSLAIAFVLPHDQISLVEGVMQAFTNFLSAYHLTWMLPILTVMLVIGSIGEMVNWIISPAKGLLQAGQNGYLPKALCKVNSNGVAGRILVVQAVLVSLVCLAFLLMPTVNASYWLLTDLSTQLYLIMYMLMFAAGLYLRRKHKPKADAFAIPGGKLGLWVVSCLGFIGCAIGVVVGFFPPTGLQVGGPWHYEMVFSSGLVGMMVPSFLILLLW